MSRSCKQRVFKECHKGLLPDGFRRQRLMLATDGSEFVRAPTEIAIALSRSFGVKLDIVSVADPAESAAVARERMAEAASSALLAGVDSEQIVRHSKQRVAAIVKAAEDADTNILVIVGGDRGRRFNRIFAGSSAEAVIGGLPCAVLVVKAGGTNASVAGLSYET